MSAVVASVMSGTTPAGMLLALIESGITADFITGTPTGCRQSRNDRC